MANSAVVGVLRALLTLDTAQFERGFKKAQDELRVFSRETKQMGLAATQLGSQLTRTLTLPILGLGGAAAKAAIDFESSFAGVRKTVDATEAEFAQLSAGMRALSKEIPINVNELNKIAEAAGALGIQKDSIVEFTRVMALLGVTTDVTSEQATESIAKIQTVFQATGKDTDRFASTLVDLGNKGASTEKQIIELANRMASAARAVGMSQAEVLGFSSAIANVGIEAEAGGTAISKVFADVSMAVSMGGDDLKAFATVAGQSTRDFAKLFKDDAATAIQQFIEGLGRAHKAGGDLNLILTELGFKEVRQARALRDLALSGDNLAGSLRIANAAWRENTALSEEARKRFETTASQLTLLWNRVKDVGITLGNALLPMIRAVIGGLDRLIPFIERAAMAFAAMPVPIQAGVVGLGLMAAAAGPLIYLFGQLLLSASALSGAFTKKGLATRALTTITGTATSAYRTFRTTVIATEVAMATGTATTYSLAAAKTALTATLTTATAAARTFWIAITGPVGIAVAIVGGIAGITKAMANMTSESQKQSLRDYVDQFHSGSAAASGFSSEAERAAVSAKLLADRTREAASAAGEASSEYQALKDRISGISAARDIQQLVRVMNELNTAGELDVASLKRVGEQAIILRQQGAKLTPELQAIVTWLERTQRAEASVTDASGAMALALKGAEKPSKDLAKAQEELAKKTDSAAAAYRAFLNTVGEREIEDIERAQKAAEEAAARHRAFQNELGEREIEDYGRAIEAKEKAEAEWRQYQNEIGLRIMEDEAAKIEARKQQWIAYRNFMRGLFAPLADAVTGGLGSLLFGFGSDDSSKRDVERAKAYYAELKKSGTASAEAITRAFLDIRAAQRQSESRWERYWKNVANAAMQALDRILQHFVNKILQGMLDAIARTAIGQRIGNWVASAFGMALPTVAAGAGAAAAGTSLMAGGPALAAALNAGGGAAAGTTAAGGAAAGGGLAASAAFSVLAAPFAAAWLGGFWGGKPLSKETLAKLLEFRKQTGMPALAGMFGGVRNNVQGFSLGGFVPPNTTVPAVLHGGMHGELVTPLKAPMDSMANTAPRVVQNITVNARFWDGQDFRRNMPRIINELKFEAKTNKHGLIPELSRAQGLA